MEKKEEDLMGVEIMLLEIRVRIYQVERLKMRLREVLGLNGLR